MRRELENSSLTFKLPSCVKLVVSPYGTASPVSFLAAVPSAKVEQGQHLKIALFLGRVHPGKRADLLIKAWRASEVGPEWKLVIAGNGDQSYIASLNQLVHQLKLDDAIKFVGPVTGTDKQYLYQRASWFLLPSEHENFGIAAMEAVKYGCAIAISDQVYLADEMPEGSEILPVRIDAWSKFMRERMQNDIWQKQQARKVAEVLLRKFDHNEVAQNWIDTIEATIGC